MNTNNENTQRKRKSPCRNTNEHDEEHPTLPHQQQQQSIHKNNINPLLDDVSPSNPQPESPKNISEPQHSRDRREAKQVRSNKPKRITITKTTPIEAPFPWATDRRATVHTLEYLINNDLQTISDQVKCKYCSTCRTIEYDLQTRFRDVRTNIYQGEPEWDDRAPKYWLNCRLPTCKSCKQQNSCKPVISEKKRSINWLFLFLGQLLGCCSVEQLKYVCKYSKKTLKGEKDRVLLNTYKALCQQLDPAGPFR